MTAGELEAARDALDETAAAIDPGAHVDVAHLYYARAWLAIIEDDLGRVQELAQLAQAAAERSGTPFVELIVGVTLAQIKLEQREYEDALASLSVVRRSPAAHSGEMDDRDYRGPL